ncbi:MAG TPA: malto-oligosyltrehalose synthase, partial [Stellaceae bacterium]
GFRAESPEVFEGGAYVPLQTSGRHAERLVAFARIADGHVAVAVAPRLVAPLLRDGGTIDWDDTTVSLPSARAWRDVLSGRGLGTREGQITAAELLADFPVALLGGTA